MENRLERQIKIPLSSVDNTNTMSIVGIFNTFMDLATEHGDMLGVGMDRLSAKGLIWVAAKTKFCIAQRPEMLQTVTVATWPETPSKIRFNRYYSMADESGRYIIEGKTEWAILDLNTGRPHRLDETYPVDMKHWDEVVCDGPFSRMSTDFDGCDECGRHTVTSADIDVSQHMNNAAYIRNVLGAFCCAQLEKMNITEIEAAYRTQCFEGEHLVFKKRTIENGLEIGVIKEDGKTAAVVKLVCNV
ncbi:MAG: hypothetical protein E7484_05260 [Ruminococcaceae bacterium]|nr:hypothetical protein [Oscillospiraceae bacterium]